MADRENIRLVTAMFAALEARDLGSVLALWADDCVDRTALTHAPPGKAGVRATLEVIDDAFPRARWRIGTTVADAGAVACRVVVEAQHRGEIYGVPPTGRQVRWQHFHYFRIADGLIVEHDAVRDDRDLLRQLGAEGPHAPSVVLDAAS